MADKPRTGLSAVSVGAALSNLFEFAASDAVRLPLGYSLDDTCGMIAPGEMGLLVARSGAGKSTWFLNVIANTPKIPTVVFNMEMNDRRQSEWLMAMSFDLSVHSMALDEVLRWGDQDARYAELIGAREAMADLYPHLAFVCPDKAPTVSELLATVEDLSDAWGAPVQRVFIDHMSLLADARDYEGVTRVSSQLHQWAMAADLAVICLQQTGRAGFDGGRNDGHLPTTLSSGLYAGEHDADWIWGLYQPQRDPKFKKRPDEFRNANEYEKMIATRDSVQGLTKLQLIKNRPYGELRDLGIDLYYESHSRRLLEYGADHAVR